MRNSFDLQSFLHLGCFSIYVIISFLLSSNALKCYQCTSIEDFPGSHPHCMKNPGATGLLVDGFAGCLEIYGNWDGGKKLVVRAGYYNKQETGRVPSCFHQESVFAVEPHFEALKFDALTSCHACDEDACNGATETTSLGHDHKLLLVFSIIFSTFLTSYVQSNL